MKLNPKYTWLWIIWIAAFGVIEFAALRDKAEGDTLSEHIRVLIGTKSPGRNWENWLFRIGLGGLLVWFVPHFFTGSI